MLHVCSPDDADPADQVSALVGFVVPKTVGNAVVRNRVRRQLRHLMRERVQHLCPGESVVVRVFPAARGKDWSELESDLDRAWSKAFRDRP